MPADIGHTAKRGIDESDADRRTYPQHKNEGGVIRTRDSGTERHVLFRASAVRRYYARRSPDGLRMVRDRPEQQARKISSGGSSPPYICAGNVVDALINRQSRVFLWSGFYRIIHTYWYCDLLPPALLFIALNGSSVSLPCVVCVLGLGDAVIIYFGRQAAFGVYAGAGHADTPKARQYISTPWWKTRTPTKGNHRLSQ